MSQAQLNFESGSPTQRRDIPLPDAWVWMVDGLFPADESKLYFDKLESSIEWRQDYILIMGKEIPLPRLQAWHGDDGCVYTYSGISLTAKPWTEPLLAIREKVEETTGANFNAVLLNHYRNGNDSVSYHADDEPGLGDEPTIASVSFGEERVFRMKHRTDRSIQNQKFVLRNGSLFVMSGLTQKHWLHGITKTDKPVGPRINLTFRYMQ
jgi:alkylated DNA repair dioxygenase AlkB